MAIRAQASPLSVMIWQQNMPEALEREIIRQNVWDQSEHSIGPLLSDLLRKVTWR
jgi:hypothetical protein